MPSTIARRVTPKPGIGLAEPSGSRSTPRRMSHIGLGGVAATLGVACACLWMVMRQEDPFRLLFPPLTRWAIRRVLPGRAR